MAAKTSQFVFDIPVHFGKVSIGSNTASIPIKADRSALKLGVADKNLCGHRLTGKLLASDSQPEQGHFAGMDGATGELESCFDVKGFAVKAKHITFSLSLSIADISLENLAHFAKRQGRLQIEMVEELDEDEDASDEDDE